MREVIFDMGVVLILIPNIVTLSLHPVCYAASVDESQDSQQQSCAQRHLTCCSPAAHLYSHSMVHTHGTALVHIIHKCRAHTAAFVPRSEAGLSPVFSADFLSCSKQTKKKCCLGDKASCYTKVMNVEETAILHVEKTGFSHDIFPPLPLTL